jgi:hypothetical protein
MKHDFYKAIEIREHYKPLLVNQFFIESADSKEEHYLIEGIVACIEGMQQQCVIENLLLEGNDSFISEGDRNLPMYEVHVYYRVGNEVIFSEINEFLTKNRINKIY